MEIINKSIRIIDYNAEKVFERNTPESFEEYIVQLIAHIKENDSVRNFKTRSLDTEVVSCALQVSEKSDDDIFIKEKSDVIAKRLLDKEIEAQKKITQLDKNIKKGSLIQALLLDNGKYVYLFAKVEHADFVDDIDFSFKTGFSKEKKSFWKTCLLDLEKSADNDLYAKIYSDTKAKFWSSYFLELDPVVDDEVNTLESFKHIESVLKRNIKKQAPRDYTNLRNSLILYYRKKDYIDYTTLVEEVFESYPPLILEQEKFHIVIDKIKELPSKKGFDFQFYSKPEMINARVKEKFDVNTGITLNVSGAFADIESMISAKEDLATGSRYLEIKTNNDELFDRYKK